MLFILSFILKDARPGIATSFSVPFQRNPWYSEMKEERSEAKDRNRDRN